MRNLLRLRKVEITGSWYFHTKQLSGIGILRGWGGHRGRRWCRTSGAMDELIPPTATFLYRVQIARATGEEVVGVVVQGVLCENTQVIPKASDILVILSKGNYIPFAQQARIRRGSAGLRSALRQPRMLQVVTYLPYVVQRGTVGQENLASKIRSAITTMIHTDKFDTWLTRKCCNFR